MKQTADRLETNPTKVILNLSEHIVSSDEIDILKLGWKHGLTTRPNTLEMMAISEDWLNAWRDGFFHKRQS